MVPRNQLPESTAPRPGWLALLTGILVRPFGRSLKSFLFSRMLAIVLLTFASVLLTATLLYENLLHRQAITTSRAIAEQTFTAINTLMVRAPSSQDLRDFTHALRISHTNSPYRIEVHRSDATNAAYYGESGGRDLPGDVIAVLNSGYRLVMEDGPRSRYLFPLLAENRCLACHQYAGEGAVLGVVEVGQNLGELTSRMRAENMWLFAAYGIVILAVILSLALFTAGRVTTAINLFRRKTDAIQTLTDLNSIGNIAGTDFFFAELNNAFAAFGELAKRLQNIAVDRDLLEFEIKILGKFIITSHVIQDWRGFIKELLVDINSILDAYVLVAFFKENGEQHKLDLFWRDAPSPANRDIIEKTVRRRIADLFQFEPDQGGIKVKHHIAGTLVPVPRALEDRDIELHTKSLLLESPEVQGFVGIGVQAKAAEDALSVLVLESVLAALLNLIGSVKAISGYTRTLEYYATRDPLTHLHNQRMFWEILEYESSRAERHRYAFAVLAIDLDNFKAINDNFGHACGDTFLHRFAGLLRKAVREGDFVSRYGGDEFTVILPETSTEQAYAVASRIADGLASAEIHAPDGTRLEATISIGIAIYPEHGTTPRDLFMVADSMMYKVKGAGKNAIAIAEPEEIGRILRYAEGVNSMVLKALEKKNVIPGFQPLHPAGLNEIFARELVMQILLDDGRILQAEEFIQAAEGLGLVYQLECLLIEKGIAAAEEHGSEGLLFINIPPGIFIAPDFPALIADLTGRHRFQPERIVFQVAERDVLANLAMLRKFAAAMKEKGYRFAVSRFASGNSSFLYLRLLPIDFIQIDNELISKLKENSGYAAFVKSIITLAGGLGIKTIAGGVEDEVLLTLAAGLGIDYIKDDFPGRRRPFSQAPDGPVNS